MTMLLHIGMSVTSKLINVSDSVLKSDLGVGINPMSLLRSTIFSVIYMYMQMRRNMYVYSVLLV